jgi:hypothetical protein
VKSSFYACSLANTSDIFIYSSLSSFELPLLRSDTLPELAGGFLGVLGVTNPVVLLTSSFFATSLVPNLGTEDLPHSGLAVFYGFESAGFATALA